MPLVSSTSPGGEGLVCPPQKKVVGESLVCLPWRHGWEIGNTLRGIGHFDWCA